MAATQKVNFGIYNFLKLLFGSVDSRTKFHDPATFYFRCAITASAARSPSCQAPHGRELQGQNRNATCGHTGKTFHKVSQSIRSDL